MSEPWPSSLPEELPTEKALMRITMEPGPPARRQSRWRRYLRWLAAPGFRGVSRPR